MLPSIPEAGPCYFCGEPGARLDAPHWSGSTDRAVALTEDHGLYIRVKVCQDSPSCRAQIRDFPRAPRRPRRKPQPLYGDFAQLAQLHGVATDGTGRRTRVAS